VEQQRAAAAQALIQAEQAEAQAARVSDLDGQGVLSQEQLETRRFQARAARATANAQVAALKDAETRARKLAVTAPVSGLVLERNVRPGDLSAGGASPWFRIAQDGQIELLAELPEEDLARVRVGQTATVSLPSGVTVQGRVRLVSPQVSAETKLGVARITLPVRSDVRAGGYGRALFSDADSAGLSAPETAVRYDADGASVMVVGADNRVKRAPVQTGPRGGGRVVLTKGPPAGTRVVATASAFLLDGDLIKPVEGAAAAQAAVKPTGPAR
jgi:HlyD family secretion protein